MVNWVQVAKQHLVHRLATRAGLRPHSVDLDDAGTVISVWVPKHKLPASDGEQRRNGEQRGCSRQSIVLLHGFAGDGILTWMFQVGALAKRYDVYVPDMLFFGGSTSPAPGRSPAFQAECIVAVMRRLGVEQCAVVGFSYGGFVAFRMAEAHPDLVRSVVATGSLAAMTGSTSAAMLRRLGAASWAEVLLPEDVGGVRSLFTVGTHRKLWLPDRILNDYLDLLLQRLKSQPNRAKIFDMELARTLKEQLGQKATLQTISEAGHLAQLERPRVFNRCLLEFLRRCESSSGDDDVKVN